jgi:hypothetical protein
MRLQTWKVLLSLTLGAITSIIGVSVWALETNNYDLTRLGLLILFAICVLGSGWIILTLATVFKTIEHTLLSVDEIKEGLLEAQQLLREYEEASCACHGDLLDDGDTIEEFLSNDNR